MMLPALADAAGAGSNFETMRCFRLPAMVLTLLAGCGPTGGKLPPPDGAGGAPSPPVIDFELPPTLSPPSGDNAPKPPDESNNCGVVKQAVARKASDVLVVLDRSHFMFSAKTDGESVDLRGDTDAPTFRPLWDEVISALQKTVVSQPVGLRWGALVYPVTSAEIPATLSGVLQSGCATESVASTPAIPLGSLDSVAFADALAKVERVKREDPVPNGGDFWRPVSLAVTRGTDVLLEAKGPQDQFMILVASQPPTCRNTQGNYESRAIVNQEAVDAVLAARMKGIQTFVIGVAAVLEGGGPDDTAVEFFNQMAEAGGRARPSGLKFYAPEKGLAVTESFGSIANMAMSCRFPLSSLPPDAGNVLVRFGGQDVTRDDKQANGWSFSPDGKTIELWGAACEAVRASTKDTLDVYFGCPGETIVVL